MIGHWKEGSPKRSGQLGWVPREEAAGLVEQCPGGRVVATVRVLFRPRPGKSPGIRMDLWGRGR